MSRKRFDEVERQIRDIALRHWKRVDGRMVRSASTELRKGRVVVFGNQRGNIYFDKESPLTGWKKDAVCLQDIGLWLDQDRMEVIGISKTEIDILNQIWSDEHGRSKDLAPDTKS